MSQSEQVVDIDLAGAAITPAMLKKIEKTLAPYAEYGMVEVRLKHVSVGWLARLVTQRVQKRKARQPLLRPSGKMMGKQKSQPKEKD